MSDIKVTNLKKKYNRRSGYVLKDISFEGNYGECIGILGKNGCGKTTLISILCGIIDAQEGQLILNESNTNLLKKPSQIKNYIGYVPQGYPFMNDLSAMDNLKLWYKGSAKELKYELSEGILKSLGVNEFISKKVSALSGGMKKRLSIGCAMINKPRILILDEPGASLDLECKQLIIHYLNEFKKSGGMVIIATHEESEINMCDKLYIMKDGVLSLHNYQGIDNLLKSL